MYGDLYTLEDGRILALYPSEREHDEVLEEEVADYVRIAGFDRKYSWGHNSLQSASISEVIPKVLRDCGLENEIDESLHWEEFVEEMQSRLNHFEVLWLYEHSGLALGTARQDCWDSRPVAFVYVRPEDEGTGGEEADAVKAGFESSVKYFCAYVGSDLIDLYVQNKDRGEAEHLGTYVSREAALKVAKDEGYIFNEWSAGAL